MLQLLIAAGLAKGVDKREICRVCQVDDTYLFRLNRKEEFKQLVNMFRALPFDSDTGKYTGLRTLLMEVGRLIYSEGEKRNE